MLDYKVIGQRIRRERIKRNLKQEEIANKMKVSIAFYSRIETGTSHINLKRVMEISSLFNIPVGELLEGTSKTTEKYLVNEFETILSKCSAKQKKFVYKVAELVIEECN